ncbi:MAG: hypothetical protein JNK05_04775 [Myxococcales bacterium]|nr:hypothetical protein [Myxococcales bacterium]
MKPSSLLVRSLASTVLAAACVLARDARADVPRCEGTDTATQGRARAEGLRRYRAATARGEINRVEMAAALEAFEAQCRAGDLTALEMRAYALAALGRQVDAAESLDAFLEARPLQTLDADARARVGAQRGAILAEVATLTVDGTATDSQVVVNGRPYGPLPRPVIRLAPGAVNLQVYGGNAIILRRSFQMGPGETRREVVEGSTGNTTSGTNTTTTTNSTSAGTTTNTTNSGSSAAENGSSSGSSSAIGTGSNNGIGDATTPVDTPPRRLSLAIPIALGGGALAMAGVAVGATVWHGSRVTELMKPECTGAAPDPACATVAGERDAAQAVQITSIVLASGLAIGAVVTTILWARGAPRSQPQAAVFCAPSVGSSGVLCAGRF